MEKVKNVTNQLANLDLSKLHFYSYGIVSKDNSDNSSVIPIFPIEKLHSEQQTSKDIKFKIREESIDMSSDHHEPVYKEKHETISLTKSNNILAKWARLGQGNRITPPNVVKGEHVVILRFSNRDEYYWETINYYLGLRKKEHAVFFFSNDDSSSKDSDIEKGYYLEVSPKNSKVKLHLGNDAVSYDFELKGKEGIVELKDDKDNAFKLDSNKKTFSFKTEKFKVENNTTELIQLLIEWVDANMKEQHTGNLGIPTTLESSSISDYENIKSKLTSLLAE